MTHDYAKEGGMSGDRARELAEQFSHCSAHEVNHVTLVIRRREAEVREECAKIAETWKIRRDIGLAIAARIRAGGGQWPRSG